MPMTNSGASALGPQLDGSNARELISELVFYGLHKLIECEVVVSTSRLSP
jgi:hypothetical protein